MPKRWLMQTCGSASSDCRSCPPSAIFLIQQDERKFWQFGKQTMTRRQVLIVVALIVTPLSAATAAPWLLYWFGLSQIEGRPTAAAHTATAEQMDGLFRRLRLPQPVQIDPISPYTYFLQGAHPSSGTRVAWIIAGSYNAGHLRDRRMLSWHLSGMALTVWLTRNWTPTELIAKAVELETPITASIVP